MHSYDANGNLATKTEGRDTWVYTWNAENQLTKVQKNSVEVARFSYDPLGRRVEKVAGGVTTAWTYDAAAILRETSPSVTYKYIQGPGIDQPLAREDASGARTYYHADGLRSIVKMTDASGAVVQTRQYDTWGNLEVGSDQAGYAFTGREWDPETGLYYYRARYYDSQVGRFASEDPRPASDGSGTYNYARNNPVLCIDPTGLEARDRAEAESMARDAGKRMRPMSEVRGVNPAMACVKGEIAVGWGEPSGVIPSWAGEQTRQIVIDAYDWSFGVTCRGSAPKGKERTARPFTNVFGHFIVCCERCTK